MLMSTIGSPCSFHSESAIISNLKFNISNRILNSSICNCTECIFKCKTEKELEDLNLAVSNSSIL